ncbi:MAG: flagellar basal body rod modification protein [Marinosulfonomonas sp.]|nr:MAG: flagellar basal body rod modification protein [Marinosulfonomonas sp.]
MEVTSVTTTQTATQTQTATSDESVVNSDYLTFLKMLTAQVKNQDPLDPMSSDDFSTQLATFSGVEQQVKTNDLLEALGAQLGAMGMSEFASWIGLEARAAAPAYFDGSPVSISPNPAAGADSAVMVVRNQDGVEVQRLDFTPSSDEIQWAGVSDSGEPFADGLYTFEVESYSGEDLLATNKAEVYSEITEVKTLDGSTVLVLFGGAEISEHDVSGLRNGI